MQDFFEDIKFLTSFVGCNIFNVVEENQKHIFTITSQERGCNARGFYDSTGFTVLKGSIISNNSTPSLNWKDRDRMVAELTKNSNRVKILDVDKTFTSPSTAAAFCIGRNTNGWTKWKDKDGSTLDDVYRKDLENS